MIRDVNGQVFGEGGLAQLLCEVKEILPTGIVVRVMNTDDMLLHIDVRRDEALGGLVASSELTAFVLREAISDPDPSQSEVKAWPME